MMSFEDILAGSAFCAIVIPALIFGMSLGGPL